MPKKPKPERTNEEIRAIVRAAFAPLGCVAEIWDYEKKLHVRVFDMKGRPVVRIPEMMLRTLQDDRELRKMILRVRGEVEAKGLHLDPWELK
jgi:hypothetical protein